MTARRNIILIAITTLVLAGCGGGRDAPLTRNKHKGNGPDEFSILPTKPLQTPESYNLLPAPTPGSANLVDQNPIADGIAALGGNPAATIPAGIGKSDGGLVNHANRYGVNPGIRQTLAQEDAETRRRHGRVNILNIGPNDDYTDAYKRQWLNGQAEQQRMKRSGVVTPSAPPPS
ncbi:DUF3035 domain-containing protein [Rhodobacteraceae bacterium KMM 6894]|nr:DUF3035 domain-containing protein [Rhodobacteraceae bacterium KMM 6894]